MVNFILNYLDYLERILVGTQVVDGLRDTGPVQINGLWGAIACVKQTDAKVNRLVIQSSSSGVQSVKLNASSPEEFFAPEHLRRIHGLFEYDSMVEFSGLADLETGVLEYEKHSGASSVFPWGPQVVFHTHPCASGAEVYSVTDLFLFACAPAWVSLLFSEFRISVLEKQKTETEYFTMLRKKLDYLRSGYKLL